MKLSALTNGLLGGSLLSGGNSGSQRLREADSTYTSVDSGAISKQLNQLISRAQSGDYCATCKQGLSLFKSVARHSPEKVTPLIADICLSSAIKGSSSCNNFGKFYKSSPKDHHSFARDLINVLTLMDPKGLDGDYFCHFILQGLCELPATPDCDLSGWWSPKPGHLRTAESSGDTFKVLHLSDIHLSLDYTPGSEGNCLGMMCCTPEVTEDPLEERFPAPTHGYYKCDAPAVLMESSLESIPRMLRGDAFNDDESGLTPWEIGLGNFSIKLAEIRKRHSEENSIQEISSEYAEDVCETTSHFDFDFKDLISNPGSHRGSLHPSDRLFEFALFTGDMIDHNPLGISKSQSIAEEKEVMYALRQHLDDIPVYAAMGNHDSYPFAQVAQQSSGFSEQFSFNAKLMADLWRDYGWMDESGVQLARLHSGGYAVMARPGLKIISLNSNFWYRWNFYNYWDTSNPDQSGSLRFLVDQLQECEKNEDRAWVIAHIPPGGIPDEALPMASHALGQILERFSPETIAGTFFGHTHMDEFTILYKNGLKNKQNAINTAWIAPSVTPLWGFNPSWRYYEVDSGSFDIMNSVTFFAHLNETFKDDQALTWQKLYSARDYDPSWPVNQPLNGKFWHNIAERLHSDPEFSQKFSDIRFRHSPYSPECVNRACMFENYCYATSMTVQQARECRETHGIEMRKLLAGGPTYPMPKPLRRYIETDQEN